LGPGFELDVPVTAIQDEVSITATDLAGNSQTDDYNLETVSGTAKSFTYDANGNLCAENAQEPACNDPNATRTYEWDAENRLLAVNQGTLRSEFSFNGGGRRIRIVEKDGGVSTADRRFLWCGSDICQERDSSGSVVRREFFDAGMKEDLAAFYYTLDQQWNVREMVDASGTVVARNEYDPFMRPTQVLAVTDIVLPIAGHLFHTPTALSLAPARIYDPTLGRWLSPDPSGLNDGTNLYAYVRNRPVGSVDPTGHAAVRLDGPNYLPAGDYRETQNVCGPMKYGCTRTGVPSFSCYCNKKCDVWVPTVAIDFEIEVQYMSKDNGNVPFALIIAEENKHVEQGRDAFRNARAAANQLEGQRFSTWIGCYSACTALWMQVQVDILWDWVHWTNPHPKKYTKTFF
jgi:RHS repeat-associated protein